MFGRLEPGDSGRKPGDWTDAPGVTAAEAAAWSQRLIGAREEARGSR